MFRARARGSAPRWRVVRVRTRHVALGRRVVVRACASAVGDLVLDAVAGHGACRAVPAFRVPVWRSGRSPSASRAHCGRALDFAVGELVAQLGVLALRYVEWQREAVAFLADRGDVAELAAERGALCEDAFELVFGAGER